MNGNVGGKCRGNEKREQKCATIARKLSFNSQLITQCRLTKQTNGIFVGLYIYR